MVGRFLLVRWCVSDSVMCWLKFSWCVGILKNMYMCVVKLLLVCWVRLFLVIVWLIF